MTLVLKWQGYRKFYVNCILENSRCSEYVSVLRTPRFCVTGYIERVLNIPRVLNMPEFCSGNKLKNNFKFKYPRPTLNNKVCLECI